MFPPNSCSLGTSECGLTWDFTGGQWLRLCASTAVGTGLIPGGEGRIRSHMPCGAAERLKKKVTLFENKGFADAKKGSILDPNGP